MRVMSKRKPPRQDEPTSGESKKPRRSGVSLSVWIPKELRQALDDYIASQRPSPDITGAVIAALEDFLQPKGFWPPQQEGDTP